MVVDLVRNIMVGEIIIPAHANVGPRETDFIQSLLHRDPEMRLGAHLRVRDHQWLEA